MLDMRKIGAYICNMRKEKDITQLALALNKLVILIDENQLNYDILESLAPFLGKDTLHTLMCKK